MKQLGLQLPIVLAVICIINQVHTHRGHSDEEESAEKSVKSESSSKSEEYNPYSPKIGWEWKNNKKFKTRVKSKGRSQNSGQQHGDHDHVGKNNKNSVPLRVTTESPEDEDDSSTENYVKLRFDPKKNKNRPQTTTAKPKQSKEKSTAKQSAETSSSKEPSSDEEDTTGVTFRQKKVKASTKSNKSSTKSSYVRESQIQTISVINSTSSEGKTSSRNNSQTMSIWADNGEDIHNVSKTGRNREFIISVVHETSEESENHTSIRNNSNAMHKTSQQDHEIKAYNTNNASSREQKTLAISHKQLESTRVTKYENTYSSGEIHGTSGSTEKTLPSRTTHKFTDENVRISSARSLIDESGGSETATEATHQTRTTTASRMSTKSSIVDKTSENVTSSDIVHKKENTFNYHNTERENAYATTEVTEISTFIQPVTEAAAAAKTSDTRKYNAYESTTKQSKYGTTTTSTLKPSLEGRGFSTNQTKNEELDYESATTDDDYDFTTTELSTWDGTDGVVTNNTKIGNQTVISSSSVNSTVLKQEETVKQLTQPSVQVTDSAPATTKITSTTSPVTHGSTSSSEEIETSTIRKYANKEEAISVSSTTRRTIVSNSEITTQVNSTNDSTAVTLKETVNTADTSQADNATKSTEHTSTASNKTAITESTSEHKTSTTSINNNKFSSSMATEILADKKEDSVATSKADKQGESSATNITKKDEESTVTTKTDKHEGRAATLEKHETVAYSSSTLHENSTSETKSSTNNATFKEDLASQNKESKHNISTSSNSLNINQTAEGSIEEITTTIKSGNKSSVTTEAGGSVSEHKISNTETSDSKITSQMNSSSSGRTIKKGEDDIEHNGENVTQTDNAGHNMSINDSSDTVLLSEIITQIKSGSRRTIKQDEENVTQTENALKENSNIYSSDTVLLSEIINQIKSGSRRTIKHDEEQVLQQIESVKHTETHTVTSYSNSTKSSAVSTHYEMSISLTVCKMTDCSAFCDNSKAAQCAKNNDKVCTCPSSKFLPSKVHGVARRIKSEDIGERNCSESCTSLSGYARIVSKTDGTHYCVCVTEQVSKAGITNCDRMENPSNICNDLCNSDTATCAFNGVCLCPAAATAHAKTAINASTKDQTTECNKKCWTYHSDYIGQIYPSNYTQDPGKTTALESKFCTCRHVSQPTTKEATSFKALGFRLCSNQTCKLRCGSLDAFCEPVHKRACICRLEHQLIGYNFWSRLPSHDEKICQDVCFSYGLGSRVIERNPALRLAKQWYPFIRVTPFENEYSGGKHCHCTKQELELGQFRPCSDEICRWVCGHSEAFCAIDSRRSCICNTHKLNGGLGRKPDPAEVNCNSQCRRYSMDAVILDVDWDTNKTEGWGTKHKKYCSCVRQTTSAGITHCEGGEHDRCPHFCNNTEAYCTPEKHCECGEHFGTNYDDLMVRLPVGFEKEECGGHCSAYFYSEVTNMTTTTLILNLEDREYHSYIYDEARANCDTPDSASCVEHPPGGELALPSEHATRPKKYCLCSRTLRLSERLKNIVGHDAELIPRKASAKLECISGHNCYIEQDKVHVE